MRSIKGDASARPQRNRFPYNSFNISYIHSTPEVAITIFITESYIPIEATQRLMGFCVLGFIFIHVNAYWTWGEVITLSITFPSC